MTNLPEPLAQYSRHSKMFFKAFTNAKWKDVMIKKESLGAWVEYYKANYHQEVEHGDKNTGLAIIPGFNPSSTTY